MKFLPGLILLITLGCNSSSPKNPSDISNKDSIRINPVDSQTIVLNDVIDKPEIDTIELSQKKSQGQSNYTIEKSIEELFATLRKPAQKFKIQNSRDTLIEGLQGTLLYIPEGAFSNEIGVEVHLEEFYTPFDILVNNLTTETVDGRLLETSGMIKIKALNQSGREVKLDEGKSIIVCFPKNNKPKPGQRLFYGKENIHNDIVWDLDSTTIPKYYINHVSFSYNGSIIDQYFNKMSQQIQELESTSSFPLGSWFNSLEFSPIENRIIENSLLPYWQATFNIAELGNFENIRLIKGINDQIDALLIKHLKKFYKENFSKYKWNPKYKRSSIYLEFSNGMDYKSDKNFKKAFKAKYLNSDNTLKKPLDEAELNFYIFNANELGVINCDRFISYTGEKVNFTLDIKPSIKNNFMLVFKDNSTYIKPERTNKNYVFGNLPKDIPATLVGLRYERNTPVLAIQSIKVNNDYSIEDLKFKELKIQELDSILNSLKN